MDLSCVVFWVARHTSHLQVVEQFSEPAGTFRLPLATWQWRSWQWQEDFVGVNHRITRMSACQADLLKDSKGADRCAMNGWNQCKGRQFEASYSSLFQVMLAFQELKERTDWPILQLFTRANPPDHVDIITDLGDIGIVKVFGGSVSTSLMRLHKLGVKIGSARNERHRSRTR